MTDLHGTGEHVPWLERVMPGPMMKVTCSHCHFYTFWHPDEQTRDVQRRWDAAHRRVVPKISPTNPPTKESGA